jgi:hypothetical protein
MPGKRAKGERLLEDALAALARALDETGAPWMIIGGIAVIAHGVRRQRASATFPPSPTPPLADSRA